MDGPTNVTHSGTDSVLYPALGDKRNVRLCQVRPDASEPCGFSLNLEEVSLGSCVPYCALSYTWGAPELEIDEDDNTETPADLVSIKVGQNRISITPNLFDFLKQCIDSGWFQSTGSPPSDKQHTIYNIKYLWIDAICINQEDLAERSHQVSIMGEVYDSSSFVVVWLGKDAPSQDVCWVLEEFIPRSLQLAGNVQNLQAKDPMCTDPDVIEVIGEDVCVRWREAWVTFMQFISKKRWFYRGWVVQEVTLKTLSEEGAVSLLCGSYVTRWEPLRKFFHRLHNYGWVTVLSVRLHQLCDGVAASRCRRIVSAVACFQLIIGHLKEFEANKGTTQTDLDPASWLDLMYSRTVEQQAYAIAFRILTQLKSFRFTDQRDRIYGSFAILKVPMDEISFDLGLDYTSSVQDVYTRAGWEFISHMATLEVLSRAGGPVVKRLPDLPSWVPDYSATFTANLFQTVRRRAGVDARAASFDASKMPVDSPVLLDDNSILLQGVKLDTISRVGPRIVRFRQGGWGYEWLLQEIANQETQVYGPTSERMDEALSRALTADSIPRHIEEHKLPEIFRRVWLYLFALRARDSVESETTILGHLLTIHSTNNLRLAGWLPSAEEFMDAMDSPDAPNSSGLGQLLGITERLWQGRSVFVTESGYIGLGPQKSQVGDEVWILEGGRTPLTLRQIPGTDIYRLIGETYMHGFMYGEGMTTERRENLGPVVIA